MNPVNVFNRDEAEDTHLIRAFEAFVEGGGDMPSHLESIPTQRHFVNYDQAAALGYVVSFDSSVESEFVKGIERLSKRKFEPRDQIVSDELALLGCDVGLRAIGMRNESHWFDLLLSMKRELGATHIAFCDAISGKYPGGASSYVELFLFLRQRQSAVPLIDAPLRHWMLEMLRRPFPYFEDFFRNMIAAKVLTQSVDLILTYLEGKSAKHPLTAKDLAALEQAEEHVKRSNLEGAIESLGGILNRFESALVHNDLLHLGSRLSGLKRKRIGNTISEEDSGLEEGKIRSGLLDLIQELRGFI